MVIKWLQQRRQRYPYLGLDLGTAAIKAAGFKGGKLLTATVPVPAGDLPDPESMVTAIRAVVSATGWQGRQVVAAIYGERVVVRYLRLPPMTLPELKAGMVYEIENYLPTGTQDMVIDWTIVDSTLGMTKPAAEETLVLLAAAPREQATGLYNFVQAAGLELAAIDLVPLALCRALAGLAPIAIIDIGRRWGNLVLVREGLPLFSRLIAVDGEALSRSGVAAKNSGADLVQEIRRSLEFYHNQAGTAFEPERLILSGGGARIEGLAEYCQEQLGLATTIGRPGRPQAKNQLDPAFAVAAGLALRERI